MKIFKGLKSHRSNFSAISGWFNDLINHNVYFKPIWEATIIDGEATKTFTPGKKNKNNTEENFMLDYMFNVDETGHN